MKTDPFRLVILGAAALLSAGGTCIWETQNFDRIDPGVDPTASPLARSAAYRDTIGSYAFYDGMAAMRVVGYGLVVGLGENGSADCPPQIFGPMVQRLHKRYDFTSTRVGESGIKPEELIRANDTAVVLVEGEIPPAAVEGNRFDVRVRTVPGTSTASLRGGRLYTCSLQYYNPRPGGNVQLGAQLAEAAGPVFLNPFTGDQAATRVSPLQGTVVGGGVVTEDRRVRLVLTSASYGRAKQIQDRINAQFRSARPVADAVSPSFIRIRVPRAYRDDIPHFLGLVRSLYLSRDPGFAASRARILAREIGERNAPHSLIALAFEALGRPALVELNKLYADSRDWVSFHAAAAGLRLGDHISVDAMALIADDAKSQYRFQAIRGLGHARGMANAARSLRTLLDHQDPRVRVAAYEGLLEWGGDPAIQSIPLGGDNFILDIVSTEASEFIYVKRSGTRRIAVFGDDLRCMPPIFYRPPDGEITINALVDAENLTLVRVTPTGAVSEPISAPMGLVELLVMMGRDAQVKGADVLGLGLDFGSVVRALYHLCDTKAVAAEFILEEPNALEIFGPGRSRGRAETDK